VIGKIAVIPSNKNIPHGWKVMQIGEARQIIDEIQAILCK